MAGLWYPRTILTISSGSAFLFLTTLYRYEASWQAQNLPLATHGHTKSTAVSVLNPLQQDLYQHRITIDIPTSRIKGGLLLGNDEILARFTRGFFGGWIFSPERWLFCLTGLVLTKVEGEYLPSDILMLWDPVCCQGAIRSLTDSTNWVINYRTHQDSEMHTSKKGQYRRSGIWPPFRKVTYYLLDPSCSATFSLRKSYPLAWRNSRRFEGTLSRILVLGVRATAIGGT
jgi:hypothetical protein